MIWYCFTLFMLIYLIFLSASWLLETTLLINHYLLFCHNIILLSFNYLSIYHTSTQLKSLLIHTYNIHSDIDEAGTRLRWWWWWWQGWRWPQQIQQWQTDAKKRPLWCSGKHLILFCTSPFIITGCVSCSLCKRRILLRLTLLPLSSMIKLHAGSRNRWPQADPQEQQYPHYSYSFSLHLSFISRLLLLHTNRMPNLNRALHHDLF